MSKHRRPSAGGRTIAGFLTLWLAVATLAGCGGTRISVGSAPFPAKKAVFLDESGEPRAALPADPEPIRLLFLDFPWCPQCGGMWEGIRVAAREFPPGTLRVYRVLFDREKLFPGGEAVEVPPLVSSPPRTPAPADSMGGAVPVVTWTGLLGPFREQFQITRVPALLLLDKKGVVAARWAGASPSLAVSLAGEIRKRTAAPLSSER